ncbi:carboxypeptidase-like regulatory domain-containing protein [Fusobacterium sp. PH5-44]|uniref:carboxypeptidase-like regulatory domain-containing protein n=1 Tax=unclassified Fusobacterium TaxID=2648384 RepID=UPI003D1F904C
MKRKKNLLIFILIFLNFFFIYGEKFSIIVQCQIKSSKLNVGNAEIIFDDVNNTRYKFKSDFLGKVKAVIPSGKYKISIFKDGKEISQEKYECVFNVGKDYSLDFNVGELDTGKKRINAIGITHGIVYDEEKNNISNVTILLKNSKGTYSIKSDEYGTFKVELPVGITTLICRKDGYLESGTIIKVEKNFSPYNVEIVLKKNRYILEGVITDGVRCIKNINIAIYDQDFNRIQETQSDQYGHYEFLNIIGYNKVYISINNSNFKRYRSELINFENKDNIRNIILEKN